MYSLVHSLSLSLSLCLSVSLSLSVFLSVSVSLNYVFDTSCASSWLVPLVFQDKRPQLIPTESMGEDEEIYDDTVGVMQSIR